MIDIGFRDLDLIVVGDKAYVGEKYAADLKEAYGIEFMAIQKNYAKTGQKSGLNKLLLEL